MSNLEKLAMIEALTKILRTTKDAEERQKLVTAMQEIAQA